MSIPQTPSPLANVIASKTYNAAWFSGATKEAQITAAIAAAVADGALYVYVPANMVSFSLNQITLNAAVKIMREGLYLTTDSVTLAYSALIATDVSIGGVFIITATNGNAFTVSNPSTATTDRIITYTIRNTSGGALGALTWDTLFKLSAWISPANGFNRSITFRYDGTNWIEMNRTTIDIPN